MMWLMQLFGGGIIGQITKPLLDAYQAKLTAQNDEDRIAADVRIQRLEGMRAIAVAEAGRAWSATSLGRWLIVVPYGLWWSGIFAVSIINGLWGTNYVILDIPPDIKAMAKYLIPAILVADVGQQATRMVRK